MKIIYNNDFNNDLNKDSIAKAFAESYTALESLCWKMVPSSKKELKEFCKKAYKNNWKEPYKNFWYAKKHSLKVCREYWVNPYEGENSIREYEQAIKFCQENIRRLNDELPFVKGAKATEYFNFEKNKYEKEIKNYQKLIETKTVTSKTETYNYNGDVFNTDGGDAFGRGSKNNKTTKTTKIAVSLLFFVIISVASIFIGKHLKMDNFDITNTTKTTIESSDSKN